MVEYLIKRKELILIALFALLIRLVAINNIPPALNWDEVSHGWNAYSILKTGKDEWGVLFPTIFRAFGDYKLPVYIYLVSLVQAFMGISLYSVRLPSILAGVGSVIFTYLLADSLYSKNKSKLIPILASLLMAISPWSFFISRAALEANLAVFFIISGTYFFIRGTKKSAYLLLSTLLLGLSVWTYNSARVFVPLFLVTLLLTYKDEIKDRFIKTSFISISSLVLLLIFLVPMFMQLIQSSGQARYEKVAIIDQGAINYIESKRINSNLPWYITKIIYNRPVYFIKEVSENIYSHFTYKFLFSEGGSNYQFSVPKNGIIYLSDLLPFYLGIILVISKFSKEKSAKLLLSWLILGPLASSLTREAPHVLRSSIILPIPFILSSAFIYEIKDRLYKERKKTAFYFLISIYTILFCYFSLNYLDKYFLKYPKEYSWAWQYGYKQVVELVKEKYDRYDAIVISKKYGEPHIFFLYYWPWEPGLYQSDPNLVRYYQSDWYWVDRFDKFYFVNDWDISKIEGDQKFVLESGSEVDCTNIQCLVVTSPGNIAPGWNKVDEVNFISGQKAFEIYEN